LKFSILVNAGPYTHQAADSALQFTCAALARGHSIFRVFFYHDGVHVGSDFTIPPQDDRHLQRAWSTLAREHDLDLVICVAAAQRRGLLDADLQQRNNKTGHNLAEGFRISGLGQLIEAGIESDRLVVFGD
jgi:tRNA 2-thiouridine synthesizing protein D